MTDTSDQTATTSAKEGLGLNADGTVDLWIEGRRYALRRPKAREYRALRESLQGRMDRLNVAADTVNDERARLNALAVERTQNVPERRALLEAIGTERSILRTTLDALEAAALTAEEREGIRKLARDLNDDREREGGEWWLEAIGTLGDLAGLTFDDLPSWALDVDEVVVLIVHWRSVPSLSGVR